MEEGRVYAEVYQILNLLDEKYKKKIPEKFYLFLEEYRNKEYEIEGININNLLREKKLQRGTVAILAILTLKYWCENQEEKDKILFLLSENERKVPKRTVNLKNLFEEKENNKENKSSMQLIEYKKANIIQKIILKIKRIIGKKM